VRSAELQRLTVASIITVLIFIAVICGKACPRTDHEGSEGE